MIKVTALSQEEPYNIVVVEMILFLDMPGLFVQKLDSRQDSEESKTAEEFKRKSILYII